MRSLKQLRLKFIEQLLPVSPSPALDVDLLLSHVLRLTPVDLILKDMMMIPEEDERLLWALVERRKASEPMAYILGQKAFMGLDFEVDQRVLIPRPDTEVVVEAVLAWMPRDSEQHILDIGTGSGAIVLSLLNERGHLSGVGLDISAEALEVAKQNGEKLGLSSRVRWLRSNLFESLGSETFDWIISNPPYINHLDMGRLDATVVDYEPHSALYGGVDGLDFYRHIIDNAGSYLNVQGYLAFEIGYDQREAVSSLLTQADFESITCYNDLEGHDRALIARLKPR